MDNSEGYFLIALGEKYINYVSNFIKSKDKFEDKREICVIVNPQDSNKLKEKVEYIINYDPNPFIKKYNLKYHHEIYGAIYRR